MARPKKNFVAPETTGNLTSRWTLLKYHQEQHALWNSTRRFNVNPAGRRSGKTELAKRKLIKRALVGTAFPDPRFFAAAPTRDQAKRIYWNDLKRLTPRWCMTKPPNESELTIYFSIGSSITVMGMDKPERIEGSPWDGGVLDEYGNMKKQTWGSHVRPALADRNGWCDLIGVPEGRNHYYDQAKKAQASMLDPDGEWAYFHWISADILSKKEIAAAKQDLDELTYLQEYEASFVNFQGRAYYPWDEKIHQARIGYNPDQPLIFCFDFNVAPGVAVICQEKRIKDISTGVTLIGETATGVIGEVHIPRNSNTPLVCNRLITDWGDHKGRIKIYGDATGGARKTSGIGGTDWDLVTKIMYRHYGESRVDYCVPKANPSERDRVNSMNSRLLTMDKKVRLFVDPTKAPMVVKDLEGVQLIEGGSGEIDKKKNPELTHLCFAAGTLVEFETGIYPIENAPENDRVRTWDGSFVRYNVLGRTQVNVDTVSVCIDGKNIECCTPKHQWLTKEGWVWAKDLAGKELVSWRSGLSTIPDRNSTARCFTGITKKNRILANQKGKEKPDCIELFGFTTMGRFQKEYGYIIKTGINQTTKLKTLWHLLQNNTFMNICHGVTKNGKVVECRVLKKQGKRLKSGTPAMKVKNGIKTIMKKCVISCMKKMSRTFVNTVAKSFILTGNVPFVQRIVKLVKGIVQKKIMKKDAVNIVGPFLKQTNIQRQDFVQENALQHLVITSVKPFKKMDVYCISVPNHGCFALANGAIVSNSDSLGYYVHKEFPVRIIGAGMVGVSGT